MQVPRESDNNQTEYRQFRADLDHYVTQMLLDNSLQRRKDSVGILPGTRDRIQSYILGLKDCISKSEHLGEAKRDALLKRLSDFEDELKKKRLNLLAVTRVAFELLAVPGALWTSADVAHKLVSNILQVVGEAKNVEHEQRALPRAEAPKALQPPRPEKAQPPRLGQTSKIIDDDIPF